MKHTLDAAGQKLGQLASQTVKLLTGKNLRNFQKNAPPAVQVEVLNVSKIAWNEKKLAAKNYRRFSGYPGGLKFESAVNLARRRGSGELFRRAVRGMLPKNKWRACWLKNLTVKD